MRDSTTAAPSAQALRAMMAMAAATASAAAGDANAVAAASSADLVARHIRHHPPRPSHNRRQSIHRLGRLLTSEPVPKGAPLPEAADGSRSRRIAEVATEIAANWVHPSGTMQYETSTLHNVRAILYISKSVITQSFVSHVSGVSQGSLSHYVRGIFRGNQKNVEDRLELFVRKFASGELDSFLGEARAGTRLPSRAFVVDAAGATAAFSIPSSAGITPQTVMIPPDRVVPPSRPPVPPPPPPQLTPAPWARPQMPPKQQSAPTLSAPPPQDVAGPTHPLLPRSAANVSPAVSPGAGGGGVERSPEMAERSRHTRHRQPSLLRKKRGRTPFTTMLEHMEEPTPVVAVERAFHALVAPSWTQAYTHAEPLLLPIELYVEHGNHTLHMFTQWDANERNLSPEVVADRIRRARGLPKEFTHPTAMQIRRALFEAGIICPPPPIVNVGENRRLIRIDVTLGDDVDPKQLRDEFEWDLGLGPVNSAELFAQHLCTDAGLPQRHAQTVARAIREKLCIAHAMSYGDERTKVAALARLAPNDPLRHPVPFTSSALGKSSQQSIVSRGENEEWTAASFVLPLLDQVVEEAEMRNQRREQEKVEELHRRRVEAARLAEQAEAARREAVLARAYDEAEDAAIELQQERGLDFRPYLAIKLAFGERPSIWTPAVFDRKRRRQTSFPMVQPLKPQARVQSTTTSSAGRSSKRRRVHRKSDPPERLSGSRSEGRDYKSMSERGIERGEPQVEASSSRPSDAGSKGKVAEPRKHKLPLVLRIRAPKRRDRRRSSGGNSKKRRRR